MSRAGDRDDAGVVVAGWASEHLPFDRIMFFRQCATFNIGWRDVHGIIIGPQEVTREIVQEGFRIAPRFALPLRVRAQEWVKNGKRKSNLFYLGQGTLGGSKIAPYKIEL